MMQEPASIRRVRREDARRMFEIRNEPSVRARSTQADEVDWEGHQRWFEEQYFQTPDNACFILETHDRVVGYCRFDARADDGLRVSIAIDPEEQGRGYGHVLLSSALREMGTARPLVAEIHVGNDASLRLFQKNHFQVTAEDGRGYILRLSPDAPSASREIEELLALVMKELPEPADAIIWLQGDRFDRGPKALELFSQGYASQIVLTGNNIFIGQESRPGEHNVSLDEMRAWLVERGVPADRILVEDQSMNTRCQAEHVIDMANANNWNTILLVASPYHQLRAFLTFLKYAAEMGWPGRIRNQPAELAWDSIPSDRQMTARECLSLEMEKIDMYRQHVATYAEGIAYLKTWADSSPPDLP